MNTQELIDLGNQARTDRNPEKSLEYYVQAMALNRKDAAAFNNYGNVLRECGDPVGAIPFLQHAIRLDPAMVTAQFNLSVALLLAGMYEDGWKMYESRWGYEHLKGALPNLQQPRWNGEDLKDKTILLISEQGLGDGLQFIRFAKDLHDLGATVIVHCDKKLKPLFDILPYIEVVYTVESGEMIPFDYWTPSMSVPRILNITLDNLPKRLCYLVPPKEIQDKWLHKLGPKKKLRVGVSWSGRRDTWINLHKSVPVETIVDLIRKNPHYEWINFQVDQTEEEAKIMEELGVVNYIPELTDFAETAGLAMHMDVILGVDSSVTHLCGALGRPTWLMLNHFATDWRWLLERDDSPWYQSVRVFRQPAMDEWVPVMDKINQYLGWFKV